MTLSPEDRHLAAEYVLGTLPAPERAAFARRLAAEPGLAQDVAWWDARLAPLAAEVAPVAPPPRVWRALERRLFPRAPRRAWWLGAAAAGGLLAALLLVTAAPPAPAPMWMAQMQGAGDLRVAVVVDGKAHELRLAMDGTGPAAGQDYEIWLVAADHAPVSLGVMPHGAARPMPMPDMEMPEGAALAISLEPAGGSPTGAPTGPVLASAPLVRI